MEIYKFIVLSLITHLLYFEADAQFTSKEYISYPLDTLHIRGFLAVYSLDLSKSSDRDVLIDNASLCFIINDTINERPTIRHTRRQLVKNSVAIYANGLIDFRKYFDLSDKKRFYRRNYDFKGLCDVKEIDGMKYVYRRGRYNLSFLRIDCDYVIFLINHNSLMLNSPIAKKKFKFIKNQYLIIATDYVK